MLKGIETEKTALKKTWLARSRPGKPQRMAKGKVYGEIKGGESKLRSDCEEALWAVPRRMAVSSGTQCFPERLVGEPNSESHRILIGGLEWKEKREGGKRGGDMILYLNMFRKH